MKRLNNEQIIEACQNIAKLIDEGWSIAIARKKVAGTDNSVKARQIMAHPLYIDLLNQYGQIHNHTLIYSFDKTKGRIIGKGKPPSVNK